MIPRRFIGAYCFVIGLAMAAMWLLLYVWGEVPELTTAPLEIGYHLIAEGMTAILLLIAGYGLFRSRSWDASALPLALGMLLYTVINSAGYYAQRGDMVIVGMFAVLTVMTGVIIIDIFRESPRVGTAKTHTKRKPYA